MAAHSLRMNALAIGDEVPSKLFATLSLSTLSGRGESMGNLFGGFGSVRRKRFCPVLILGLALYFCSAACVPLLYSQDAAQANASSGAQSNTPASLQPT